MPEVLGNADANGAAGPIPFLVLPTSLSKVSHTNINVYNKANRKYEHTKLTLQGYKVYPKVVLAVTSTASLHNYSEYLKLFDHA